MGHVLSLFGVSRDVVSVWQPDRPLILWQLKRESDPFIDDQGKEALNFQITVAIASAICYVLMFILVGFALLGLVLIGAVVLVVIAGVKANDGVVYRYPFTWRPLK